MKSYNIIYKNNKFYDISTNKRVYPKENGQFVIAGDDNNFGAEDILNQPHSHLNNAEEQFANVHWIKNIKQYVQLLPAGSSLEFDFSISKLKHQNEEYNYSFRLELLEDLYLYTATTWKAAKLPELHDCRCVVIEDLGHNVDFFEPIFANSINEAYSKTRQFYFPNQGTPGASVYLVMKFEGKVLDELRKKSISEMVDIPFSMI